MENIETVIVGAGQSGLATAQRLRNRGRECVILDHNQRIGDGWRRQWDSLRLYSPAKFDGLPGQRFPADPWSFPTKDDVAAYLEAYAGRWDLPVRHGTRVGGLAQDTDDGFVVTTDAGPIHCDNVVVARHLRKDTRDPRLRPGPGSLHPAAALQRVPATRAAPGPGTRHGSRAFATGSRS